MRVTPLIRLSPCCDPVVPFRVGIATVSVRVARRSLGQSLPMLVTDLSSWCLRYTI